jgi:hypothetical protein
VDVDLETVEDMWRARGRTSLSRVATASCNSAMPLSTFERSAHAVEREAELDERDRHRRLHADDDRSARRGCCAIAAMLLIMRPMNESTTSSEEMSISTPRARVLTIRWSGPPGASCASRSCMSTWIVTSRKPPILRIGIAPRARL